MAILKKINQSKISKNHTNGNTRGSSLQVSPPQVQSNGSAKIKKKYVKTKLTKGSQLFPGVDKRNWYGRRIHQTYYQILEDKGGRDNISMLEDSIIRQLVALITTGEVMARNKAIEEHCMEEGLTLPEDHIPYDYLEHLTLVRTTASVAKQIGLKRVPKQIKKEETLDDYLKTKTRKPRRPPVVDASFEEVK